MLSSEAVKRRAGEIGFDLCGIAPAAAFPELRFFREWIDRGYAGTMGYLPRTAERRSDVRRVLPAARSVIVLGAVYDSGQPYSTERDDASRGEVARYAWSRDYHEVLGRRTSELVGWMRDAHPEPFEARAYVDTGPIQERVYAQYAGLGWIGKNACVINPGCGSWILLAEIVSSLELQPDAPALDQCGTCTLCLDACPTGAIVEPHVLDATRCISYLTIEYRGVIPEELRDGVGSHLFGCDICQEVCPWNGPSARKAGSAGPADENAAWTARGDINLPSLIDLWRRDDDGLRAYIGDTPLTRAGVRGLRRNLAVALGNSADSDALSALGEPHPEGQTHQDPLVREHVEWAKRKLALSPEV
jgi:epoxyqueuosine reductase